MWFICHPLPLHPLLEELAAKKGRHSYTFLAYNDYFLLYYFQINISGKENPHFVCLCIFAFQSTFFSSFVIELYLGVI